MSTKMLWRVGGFLSLLALSFGLTSVQGQTDNPLPAPTGKYSVGVQWRHWIDETRDETFDQAPHGKREMMVELLYPANTSATAKTAEYIPNRDQVLPAFSQVLTLVNLNVPLQGADVAGFQTHAVENAPLSSDQTTYPVLVFSPGGGADVSMYTAQLEELASHGYVVAAINSAYGTSAILFPDGHTVMANYSLGFEGTAALWSQDQRFVIDQLEQVNQSDPENVFSHHLDLEHLGVFGQSLGGSAATMTCFADERCKALVVGDSPIYGDVIQKGLDQPILYLLSDSRFFSDPAFFSKSHGPVYDAAFRGFEHLDFGDFPLWQHVQPFRDAKWLGSVKPARAVELTRAYLVAFFDQYLKGQHSKLLDGASADYPEVILTVQKP